MTSFINQLLHPRFSRRRNYFLQRSKKGQNWIILLFSHFWGEWGGDQFCYLMSKMRETSRWTSELSIGTRTLRPGSTADGEISVSFLHRKWHHPSSPHTLVTYLRHSGVSRWKLCEWRRVWRSFTQPPIRWAATETRWCARSWLVPDTPQCCSIQTETPD